MFNFFLLTLFAFFLSNYERRRVASPVNLFVKRALFGTVAVYCSEYIHMCTSDVNLKM